MGTEGNREARPAILFVMNRWQSSAGGIQTVNRELACALAKRSTHESIALVTSATAEERRDAQSRGVRLIAGDVEDDWTAALLSTELAALDSDLIVAVVGHSYFSGVQAQHLKRRFFTRAVSIQFVHMSPLDTESKKGKELHVKERERKLLREIELATSADLVACFGPSLGRYMRDQLRARNATQQVVEITGGMSRPDIERIVPERPTVLCLGRTESIGVKGLDIFAKVAGRLHRQWMSHPSTSAMPSPIFVVRGAASDAEALESTLLEIANKEGGNPEILVRPYTPNSQELRADYLGASVFMMPSRAEGYGLVACEALTLGVPVLMSSKAGFAEVVVKAISGSQMSTKWSVVEHGEDAVTVDKYAEAALDILCHQKDAENYVNQLRELLLPVCSWDAAIVQMISVVEKRSPGHQPALRDVSQPQEVIAYPDAASVLRRNVDQLRVPGVIGTHTVVRQAIVVMVEKGKTPVLPRQVEGVDVVVREVEMPQFAAAFPIDPGDIVKTDTGVFGCLGPAVRNTKGELRWLTTLHVVAEAKSLSVHSSKRASIVEVVVESVYLEDDVAVLAPKGPPISVFEARLSPRGTASLGARVMIVGPQMRLTGVIAGVEVNMNEGPVGKLVGLFCVEIPAVSRGLRGLSGASVLSESGALLGMVAAASGETLIFALPLTGFLERAGLDALAVGFASPTYLPKQLTVGMILDHPRTLEAVLATMPIAENVQVNGTSYVKYHSDGAVVFARALTSLGNLGAAVAATKMLLDHTVDIVVLVGIAAGLHAQRTPNMVVVSSEIVHYEPARIDRGGTTARFRVVGFTPRWISDLVAGLENVAVGPIASGEKVFTDRAMLDDLLGGRGQVLAVEMEGAGVAEAVSYAGASIPFVAIRGVAEVIGDNFKTEAAAANAVQSACAIAHTLISRLPQSIVRTR